MSALSEKHGGRGDGRRLRRSEGRESQPALFEFVDVVAELQCRPQLQPQIFHHHLAFQQEQSISVDLLSVEPTEHKPVSQPRQQQNRQDTKSYPLQ